MKPLDPRLISRSRTVRKHLISSVALGFATASIIIVVSWVIAEIVSRRFDGALLAALPLVVVLAFALRAVIAWGHAVVSERAAVRVKQELRDEVVDDLLDPQRLGPRPESSRLITLLGPGMDAFDGYIGRFIPQLGLALVVPATMIIVIAWVDLLSAAIITVTLPLIGVFMSLVGLLTRDKVQRRWAAMERLGRHFADVLDGLVILKVFGRRQEDGLAAVGDKHRRESMRALRLAFLSSLVLELFATISVALVAVSIGLRVVEGQMELQPAMFVLLLAPEAYLPVRRVGMMFHDSTEGATAALEVLDLLEHERHRGAKSPSTEPLFISWHEVEVRYEDRAEPVLLAPYGRIRAGEVVAITGPSGSGKSTFLQVLLAMISPSRGSISVNGIDLSEISVQQWRSNIAWVPQVPGVLADTVAENVRLGCPSASIEQVERVLREVGLDLDPFRVLAENGHDISAGERRRLAIARAILAVRYGSAILLLLDEPTAGLDGSRELDILALIGSLGVTAVIVAHRPEAIAFADRAIELFPSWAEANA